MADTTTTAKPSFFQTAGGIAISVGVLFVTVWVVSKAWKSGQKTAQFVNKNFKKLLIALAIGGLSYYIWDKYQSKKDGA